MRDDFHGPALDDKLWVDHYLPHWTTPERSRARYDFGDDLFAVAAPSGTYPKTAKVHRVTGV
ncbi:hypothetical protein ACQP2E_15000 [Actinoplanes sp. CA-015351]|uniref:hypothetical protein n=1 Tax=Actinoplanes sp. CA-015351 TaxID=3239897 RepID=UPI003D97E093